MPFTSARVRTIAAGALLTLLSCSESPTSPDVRQPDDTQFLHVTYEHPKLVTTSATFWAVKGRASGVDLWYHARPGQADSAKFIEFRIGANALDRRPDGSVIATGDSVRIALTVTDPTHMVINLQPTGLRFATSDQPLLKMYWTACGDDLNYDGVVDAADDALINQLNIWRQEREAESWAKQISSVVKTLKEVNTRLGGFSGYAIMF